MFTLSIFDIDRIVNGTPQKRLINGYEKMKENYTESSAQEFLATYNNEPLSFLLENSRMIFSEPYYGCSYYKEAIVNNACCNFTALEKEYEKVQDYLEENGSNMNESQKNIYDDLMSSMKTLLEHTKNTRVYASYIKENIDDTFEEKLSDMVFEYMKSEEKDESGINELFESVTNPVVFFTYAPYIMRMTSSTSLYEMTESFCEKASVPESYDELQWKTFTEAVICGNKLSLDKTYKESVSSIYNRDVRFIFEYFMNTSLDKKIDELVEEHVKEADVVYKSEVSAINNIFNDIMEAAIDSEENENFKLQIDTYKGIAYEATLDVLSSEYQQCDDTDELANGYTIMKDSLSLENAFKELNTLYTESVVFTESEEDDVTDDDIDSMDREVGGPVDGKKPQAPKPKNKLNEVQFKAMDREAKWQQKRAKRKQKGQDLINAAKAVASIPLNILNSIKGQVHAIDEMDDERRRKYMSEPGFRKKAFRNLKVAILYGSAASVNMAMIPTVAVCRHLSKKKSRRIRNELIRDLQTEIKVCEEKIADANARSDEQEKYRLIRIKDKLDAEMLRVKTNSQYI